MGCEGAAGKNRQKKRSMEKTGTPPPRSRKSELAKRKRGKEKEEGEKRGTTAPQMGARPLFYSSFPVPPSLAKTQKETKKLLLLKNRCLFALLPLSPSLFPSLPRATPPALVFPLEGHKKSLPWLPLSQWRSRRSVVKREEEKKKRSEEKKKSKLLFKNGRGIKKERAFFLLLPQTPLATAEPSAAAGEGAAAASAAAAASSSSPLLPPFPAALAPAAALAEASAAAAAAAAPAGLVMSWIDALLRSLRAPPEARRMKYFWAWEATCVGVRVVTQLYFFIFVSRGRGGV